MPQLLLLVAAGAGLYSGYKWVTRELAKAPAAQKGRGPKDLGSLVWDEKLGAYRPQVD